MTTPHAFIAAQLDAEQAAAHDRQARNMASARGWTEGSGWTATMYTDPYPEREADITTLRRVAADRRVLELHEVTYATGMDETWETNPMCDECRVPSPCPTIRAFVSRYPDAPGFREEWT